MALTLGELLAGVAPVPKDLVGVEIAGLAYDSRAVAPGALFCCVPGFGVDGHDFAPAAVAAGAAALLVERPLGLGVPEIEVPSVRAAMGPVAARFYGDPTAELAVVGVTGTNGKTTTAYLVRALLEAAGVQTGLLGTVKSVIGGVEHQVERTTPEAIDLQRDLRAMLDAGDRACAIEVSSHALALGRTHGIRFAAAIFTNLTQDHLDFHLTIEDYFLAKRSLFVADGGEHPGVGVVDAINVGDPYGRRLAGEVQGAVTFAVERDDRPLSGGEASYVASDLRCDARGCRFVLHVTGGRSIGDGGREVELPLPGSFNVENALGALAAVHGLGYRLDTLLAALERGVRVPGRLEPVQAGQEFAVLIDYAHTPDSLENVLRSARDLTDGRLICVFGAGGDRDRGKRPLMGEIAARLSDVTIVTSDNPRSEDPQAIVDQIVAGIGEGVGKNGVGKDARGNARSGNARSGEAGSGKGREDDDERIVHVEVDRRRAIERAIGLAGPGDVVVIAGKGHEQGQELAGGVKVPFDDATVAQESLGRSMCVTGRDERT